MALPGQGAVAAVAGVQGLVGHSDRHQHSEPAQLPCVAPAVLGHVDGLAHLRDLIPPVLQQLESAPRPHAVEAVGFEPVVVAHGYIAQAIIAPVISSGSRSDRGDSSRKPPALLREHGRGAG